MNLASWIILGIVAVVVALAARATFFTAKRGGCCGSKEPESAAGSPRPCDEAAAKACSCGSCAGCDGCSTAHVLQPTIRPIE